MTNLAILNLNQFRTAVRYLKNVLQLPSPVEAVVVLVDIIADDSLFLFAEDQNIKMIQLSGEEVDADDPAEKERFIVSRLRDLIDEHFNEDELRNLVMDLPVVYENLGGKNKVGKIRELVLNSKRHGFFMNLLNFARKKGRRRRSPGMKLTVSLAGSYLFPLK